MTDAFCYSSNCFWQFASIYLKVCVCACVSVFGHHPCMSVYALYCLQSVNVIKSSTATATPSRSQTSSNNFKIDALRHNAWQPSIFVNGSVCICQSFKNPKMSTLWCTSSLWILGMLILRAFFVTNYTFCRLFLWWVENSKRTKKRKRKRITRRNTRINKDLRLECEYAIPSSSWFSLSLALARTHTTLDKIHLNLSKVSQKTWRTL